MNGSFWYRSALLAVLASVGPAKAAMPDAKEFGWHNDYAAAKAEARRTGKPLLLVFRCEP